MQKKKEKDTGMSQQTSLFVPDPRGISNDRCGAGDWPARIQILRNVQHLPSAAVEALPLVQQLRGQVGLRRAAKRVKRAKRVYVVVCATVSHQRLLVVFLLFPV